MNVVNAGKDHLQKLGLCLNSLKEPETAINFTNYDFHVFLMLVELQNICRLVLLGLKESDRFEEADLMPRMKLKNFLNNFRKQRKNLVKNCSSEAFDKLPLDFDKLGYFSRDDQPPVKRPCLIGESYAVKSTRGRPADIPPVKKLKQQLKLVKKSCSIARHKLLSNKIEELEATIAQQEKFIDQFLDQISEINQKNRMQQIISLKNGHEYSGRDKLGFAKLATKFNIAHDNVGPVLETVADMFHVQLLHAPSKTTVSRSIECLAAVNSKQISEALSELKDLNIQSDETIKLRQKVQTYLIDGFDPLNGEITSLVVGLEQVVDKSTSISFDTLKSVIDKICLFAGIDNQQFSDNFFMNLKSTMGDRAVTQMKFNDLLESYKQTVAERVAPDFSKLSDEEQGKHVKIIRFFCTLLLVQNLTQVVTCTLANEYSLKNGFNDVMPPPSDKLIKTVATLFGTRSAGRHKSSGAWQTYVTDHGLTNAKISNFDGHRFNVYFFISAQIFHNRERLLDFLKNVGREADKEHKLSAMLIDPETIAFLRILGLIDKLITGPLWRLSESSSNILEMRNWAIHLINYCEKVVDDPEHFLLATSPFCNGPDAQVPKINQDEVFTTLVDNLEIDLMPFLDLISNLFKNILHYFERMLNQFLPKGEFENYGDDETELVAAAPLSNRKSESVFGYMDYLFHKAPSMSINTRMVYIQAIKNKVFDWFEKKSLDKQDKILQKAIKKQKIVANKIKQDKILLHSSLWTAMIEEKRLNELADKKFEECKSHWGDKVESGVKLDTIEAVDEVVSKNKQTIARKIIVANIRNYQYQMIQSGKKQNKDLFKVSKKGKELNLTTLMDKLKLIISKQ